MIRGFPEIMKAHRKKLNISIDKLSKLSNIDKSTLYKYERGEMSPSGIRLLKICSVLKIDYKALGVFYVSQI